MAWVLLSRTDLKTLNLYSVLFSQTNNFVPWIGSLIVRTNQEMLRILFYLDLQTPHFLTIHSFILFPRGHNQKFCNCREQLASKFFHSRINFQSLIVWNWFRNMLRVLNVLDVQTFFFRDSSAWFLPWRSHSKIDCVLRWFFGKKEPTGLLRWTPSSPNVPEAFSFFCPIFQPDDYPLLQTRSLLSNIKSSISKFIVVFKLRIQGMIDFAPCVRFS